MATDLAMVVSGTWSPRLMASFFTTATSPTAPASTVSCWELVTDMSVSNGSVACRVGWTDSATDVEGWASMAGTAAIWSDINLQDRVETEEITHQSAGQGGD